VILGARLGLVIEPGFFFGEILRAFEIARVLNLVKPNPCIASMSSFTARLW